MASGTDRADADSQTDNEGVRAGVGQRVTYSNVARRLDLATVDPRFSADTIYRYDFTRTGPRLAQGVGANI